MLGVKARLEEHAPSRWIVEVIGHKAETKNPHKREAAFVSEQKLPAAVLVDRGVASIIALARVVHVIVALDRVAPHTQRRCTNLIRPVHPRGPKPQTRRRNRKHSVQPDATGVHSEALQAVTGWVGIVWST